MWFFAIVTGTHVVAGILGLILAPLAKVVPKGGNAHRRWGRMYFWAMAVIFGTALLLLLFRPSIFLLGVAVLSFYAALSGYRVLFRKQPDQQSTTMVDWSIVYIALAFGTILVSWGSLMVFDTTQQTDFFPILGMVFGANIIVSAVNDPRMLRHPPPDKRSWQYVHMDRMLGSYIGLTTAFLVQIVAPHLVKLGMPIAQLWEVWLALTVIATLGIAIWINHDKQRVQQVEGTDLST